MNEKEFGNFLRQRRKLLSLETVEVFNKSKRRRTNYPLREEIASLLNISTQWYTRMEQGNVNGVSEDILNSIAQVFQLCEGERAYLFALAGKHIYPEITESENLLPILIPLVESQPYPTLLNGDCWDILTENDLARNVFGDATALPVKQRNSLWYLLLYPEARQLIVNWEKHTRHMVSLFRADHARRASGAWLNSKSRAAYDARFNELFEELIEKSPHFAEWWEEPYGTAQSYLIKEISHPVAGLLSFHQVVFILHEYPSFVLTVYMPVNKETVYRLELLKKE